MSTETQSPTQQAADVLDKAADHLAAVGLHKGYLYDERQAKGSAMNRCRVCAVGAILTAAYGTPRYAVDDADINVTDRAIFMLTEKVGEPIPSWNDHPDRTQDEVITALRDTANQMREAA
ncbi:hypothetical protein [Streptomyces sp. AC555_RSS877]|uniref:DUF6197 family protein n=1 Tax=Streptomyces sp. AC555_RSS877 TaxID=2823688 RepID=UPI001C275847|nr:hypothetical protein [Streptomyces sp. AC555_RSS877]